jgi:hypothetical protein
MIPFPLLQNLQLLLPADDKVKISWLVAEGFLTALLLPILFLILLFSVCSCRFSPSVRVKVISEFGKLKIKKCSSFAS